MIALLQLNDPPIRVLEVRKISQVTGETDRERNIPTDNRTETTVGLRGVDLGASFEHNGQLVFLFGDTWPTGPNTPDRPVDGMQSPLAGTGIPTTASPSTSSRRPTGSTKQSRSRGFR